ncbi:MAG: hypothetical protein JEY96_18900 [Bacteroidales bacterium]|nr:hypothetical protein [Bacteroidales bacterium]
MRKINLVWITLFVVFSLINVSPICAQKFSNPVSYMEYISMEHELISKNMWDYIKASAHSKRMSKIDKKRKELISTTAIAKRKIERMPDYEGYSDLRDSVVSYLGLSYLMLTEDYAEIVDLEEIAEQSYDLMEAYLLAKERANEKMDQASLMVNNEQKKFAEKYDINLIDSQNKIAQNLEKAGEVITYYNKVYLIFFKSYKQEAYLMDALTRADVNGIEQNRSTLLKDSDEGNKKLIEIKGYAGDISIKRSCQQLLNFYKTEASTKTPILTDFYLKKEKFEKISTAFEAKRNSEKTQDDVDNFNKAVSDYNNAIKSYNRTNDELNNMRNNLLENWNKTVNAFMDKHVP